MAQGGKTGFDEFYDYEGSKRIIEALEKDLRELGSVFKAFTTNLRSFSTEFKKSFSETTQTINANNAAIKRLDKTQIEAVQSIISYTKENEKLNKAGKETKATIQSVDQIVKNFSKSVDGQKQLIKALTAEFNKLDPTVAKDAARLRELSNELVKAKTNISQITKATRDSNNVLTAAAGSYNALTQAIAKDVDKLKQVPGAVDRSSSAYRKNRVEIEQLQARIASNTATLKAFDAQMGRNFRNVGNYSSALMGLGNVARTTGAAFGFVGGAFLLAQGVRESIRNNIELSDSLVNVQRTTDLTDKAVRDLHDSLKNIDTRTAVSNLLEIATAAGRLQVAEKDLIGFVKSVDVVTQALGDELTGTAEEIATSLGRIVSLFGDDKAIGLEQSIIRIGSVINKLGQDTKSNAGFVTDFTLRLSGIAPQAKIASEEIAALGAVFGEIAPQRVEAASTAVTRFFIQLGKNSEQYSKVVGMSVEEFSKLVNEDAVEAFIRVFEAAGKTEGGLQSLAESLGDLGVDQQRAIQVLGAFANSTDRAREILAIAKEEAKDGLSVYEEFEKRNTNLAASAEKLGKEFEILTTGTGFLANALQVGADSLTAFIKAIRLLNEGDVGKVFSDFVNDSFGIGKNFEEGQKFAQAFSEELGTNLLPTIEFYAKRVEDMRERILKEPDEVGGFAGRQLYKDLNDEIERTEGILSVLNDQYKNLKAEDVPGEIEEQNQVFEEQMGIIESLTGRLKYLSDEREKSITLERIVEIDKETEAIKEQIRAIDALKDSTKEAFDSDLDETLLEIQDFKPPTDEYKEFANTLTDLTDSYAKQNDMLSERIRLSMMAKDAGLDMMAAWMMGYEGFAENIVELEKYITEQVRLNQQTRQALYDAFWDAASMAGNQYFTNESINRQNDFEEFKQSQDLRLEAAGENHALRAQIEAETQEREREFRIQQAEAARDQALFNIALDTAQKIAGIKLAASLAAANAAAIGQLAGPAVAAANAAIAYSTVIAQVPIALGLAALQAGLVLSQPLPAYSEGGTVTQDGPIVVNDRPRGSKVHREVITTPHGKRFFYDTDKPVVTNEIPRGSVIDPRDVSELTNVSSMIKDYSPVVAQTNALQKQFEVVLKQDKSVHYEMQLFLKRENEQLIDGFRKIINSQPKEVWGISHGRLAKTYIESNQKINGWRDKNRD